jgi:CspA family cold shock protein
MAQFDSLDQSGSGPMKATVKWFNPSKGFGFVTLEDGTDAFCHASAVNAANGGDLPQGATVICNVAQGQRGLQVTTIHSVDLSTASPQPMGGARAPRGGGFGGGGFRDRDSGFGGGGYRDRDSGFGGGGGYRDRNGGGFRDRDSGGYGGGNRDRSEPSGPMVGGHVKFFNEQKGFGFVVPDDGTQDIYVHASALRRSGVSTLSPDQKVRFSTRQGMKGVEVDRIEQT